MAFLNSMSVVGSGLTAQQQRLDVISENITNMNTTRTEDGGPYTRKIVVLEAEENNSFSSAMARASQKSTTETQGGVRVAEIIEDTADYKLVYDPTHPDANELGYVEMPNVDLIKETADAMAASQAFSANATAFGVLKQVTAAALQIGK